MGKGEIMTIANINPGMLWSTSAGPAESSVTIARGGGAGWAFAEVQLAWVSGGGPAYAWISGARIQRSPDQIDNWVSPDPGGSYVGTWLENCLSVTFTLRDTNGFAAAVAKLSPWQG